MVLNYWSALVCNRTVININFIWTTPSRHLNFVRDSIQIFSPIYPGIRSYRIPCEYSSRLVGELYFELFLFKINIWAMLPLSIPYAWEFTTRNWKTREDCTIDNKQEVEYPTHLHEISRFLSPNSELLFLVCAAVSFQKTGPSGIAPTAVTLSPVAVL